MQLNQEQLRSRVIGAAMEVHNTLGMGFLESVYRNALLWELAQAGIQATSEQLVKVHYKNAEIGHFYADVLIENRLILELKAASALSSADEQQLVNYLKASGIDDGLLFNFGSPRLEFHRKVRLLSTLEQDDSTPSFK